MDEMTLKLRSGFLKKIAAKLLSGVIYSKLGVRVDILIEKLEIESIGGNTSVAASLEMSLPSSEFAKIASSFAKNTDNIMKEG